MKVFEVHTDPAGEFKNQRSQYHQLVVDDRAFESRDAFLKYLSSTAYAFLGEQKENWSPPVMQLFEPSKLFFFHRKSTPDFWHIGSVGAFAAGTKAMEITGDFLERAGQLLPLPFKNEALTICNVLERSECIDENVTPWKFEPISGQRQAPRRPCFVTSKLPKSSLFKITDGLYKTYAWEKNGDPQQEFKACVEANGLTGLRFEPVWSEEEGIIP